MTLLAHGRAAVDLALRSAVGSLPPAVRQVAEYHFGWRDREGRDVPGAAGAGQALRPALTMLIAGTDEALPGAVAIELVHNFALLHDDVVDGDRTRRHRPTAWTVFGVNPAIQAGDALLALAFAALNADRHPVAGRAVALLGDTVLTVVDGRRAELDLRPGDADVPRCLRVSTAKTAALFGCAFAVGALYAGADVERLYRIGEWFGLALRFIDDLLGIWGDPAQTGRPPHADLRNRTKSLPVVRALTSGTPAGDRLAHLFGSPGLDLAEAAALVEAAGARAWCQAQADTLLARAVEAAPEGLRAQLAAIGASTAGRTA